MAEPIKKPKGQALKWSDKDLDSMTKIGPEDITSARAYFARHAQRKFKTLLDAKKK